MAKPAFDHCSQDYAKFRPEYPEGVFDLLAHKMKAVPRPIVADVGAGTGIFSRGLANRGFRVVAIEPSQAMLGHIRPNTRAGSGGAVACLRATAERTALACGTVHAVTCAQAFHWFNPPFALAEFGRILMGDGLLMLVWNNRDAGDAFVSEFHDLVATWNPSYRREYRQQDWATKAAAAGVFGPMEVETFRTVWRLPQEDFVGFTRSVSYVRNVLSRKDVPVFEANLRSLMRRRFGAGDCAIPMVTEAWLARRRLR